MTLLPSARWVLDRECWSCIASTRSGAGKGLQQTHHDMLPRGVQVHFTETLQRQGGRPLFWTSIIIIFAACQIRTRNRLTPSKTGASKQTCQMPPKCSWVCSCNGAAPPGSSSCCGAQGHSHPKHSPKPQSDECCQHVQLGEQRPANDQLCYGLIPTKHTPNTQLAAGLACVTAGCRRPKRSINKFSTS